MRVISKRRIRQFWESRRGDAALARRDLSAWYTLAKYAIWGSFADTRQTFGSADRVGNCVVFDVGNNRFRLIGRINYAKGILYVLRVMDHVEYDRNLWPDDCGCHLPPTVKPPRSSKPTPSGRKRKR